jgi:hypothetical protein
MVAPPWISVPAPGYGGVEPVVSTLTEALVERGYDVTLFYAPGSRSTARVVTLLDEPHPDEIERSLYEVDHVARAFAMIDRAPFGGYFDVVHDHFGFTAIAMAGPSRHSDCAHTSRAVHREHRCERVGAQRPRRGRRRTRAATASSQRALPPLSTAHKMRTPHS